LALPAQALRPAVAEAGAAACHVLRLPAPGSASPLAALPRPPALAPVPASALQAPVVSPLAAALARVSLPQSPAAAQ
jgi:hypothetical protein